MRIRKKSLVLLAAASLAVPIAASAQLDRMDLGPPRIWEGVEISLVGGFGQTLSNWTSLHLLVQSSPLYPSVSAQNRIGFSPKAAAYVGGSATFFLRSGLAFQGGFGYLKAGVNAETSFQFQHNRGAGFSGIRTFEGTGEITTVPIFINFVNTFGLSRRGMNPKFKGSFSIGPALFFHSLLVDAFGGTSGIAVATGPGGVQDEFADGFMSPIKIEDTSWVSVGGDIGLTLDYRFAGPLALTLESRFFYAPKKNLSWKWLPGTTAGLFGVIPEAEITQDLADANTERTTSLVLKPSCVQVSAGIKIIF